MFSMLRPTSRLAKLAASGPVLAALICAASTAAAQTYNNTIFGPNVYVIPSNIPSATLQTTLNGLNGYGEFDTHRAAVLFMPGTYSLGSTLISAEGFYESIAGLGTTPDAVQIQGNFDVGQADSNGNGTDNFWRSQENMEVTPNGEGYWGVAQGASYRRMHVNGNLQLTNYQCGYASGGFISNSLVTGQLYSCSEQQYYVRNTQMGSWKGSNWNMVFSGDTGAPPAQNFGNGNGSFTVLPTTPLAREKPFLYVDASNNYNVFVPALKTNSSGYDWASGLGNGTSLPISSFFLATPSSSLASINNALTAGQNLILTPGIYNLTGTIDVTKANTVVLGLGYATLIPGGAYPAISTADADGVILADFIVDAPANGAPVLVEVGSATGSAVSHASNPPQLDDVVIRIGGAEVGTAQTGIQVDANNTIMDNIWSWRADHGAGSTPVWTGNPAAHGLIVNGNNVLATGLAVEHYQQSQVVWNGNNGETIFYQSELPYDVPSQSQWMYGSARGYPAYQVTACSHTAYGLGVYSYFDQGVNIFDDNAILTPNTTGINMTDMVTVFLTGSGGIANIINNTGGSVQSGAAPDYLKSYVGNGTCTTTPSAPAAPTNLTATPYTSSQIVLNYTASTTSGVSYNIYRSTTANFTPSASNQIGPAHNVGTTYTDTGLTSGTTYYYVVEAVNSAGTSSAPSNQASATPLVSAPTAPVAPTNLNATVISATQINLGWTASTTTGALSYNVYRSTASGFTPSATTQVQSGLTGTTYADQGLTPGTTYFYVVEAVNAQGNSPASNQVSATTQTGSTGCTTNCNDVVAIDAGSSSAVGAYSADVDYSGGGTYAPGQAVTVPSTLTNPAPAAVYGSARQGAFTYTIPGLSTTGSYTVRLHFAELYFSAAGQRVFNVAINGTTVLPNFDIIAAAGKSFTAVIEQFPNIKPNSSGQIVISFTNGTADQPMVNGIEVQTGTAAPSTATSIDAGGPATGSFIADTDFAGGGTYAPGQTVTIPSTLANPAPEAVYQSARQGAFTYTIPGFPAGSLHTVTLHFAELYFSATGQRLFNVSINGTQVLTNFDIVRAAGGKGFTAVIEQFPNVAANASGQYVISFTNGTADQPMVNGIVVQ